MYDRRYYETHRERINQKQREQHTLHREARNERRRTQYQQQRSNILLKQQQDRAPCPLCQLTFRRLYIPTHISRRHATTA